MSSSDRFAWGRTTVETACPLDCPDSCSLAVAVENGRVVRIDGSLRSATTNSFICAKVRAFDRRVYADARLQYPAVRSGRKGSGAFARVSWDEALGLVADKLREARDTLGGEAILPFYYGGSNGLVTQGTVDFDLFRRLGASRLLRTLCAAPSGAAAQALYGKMAGVAYEDYVHARLIIVWGANPAVSGIHLVPFIRQAQKRGATVVVVDPRHTSLARTADLHLPVRPGTDLPVALALHRFLFEEGLADQPFLAQHTKGSQQLRERAAPWTIEHAARVAGIDVDALRQLARLYATTTPAVIRCGWGPERNRNGGSAIAAILALPAVAGKFGVRGGGFTMSNSGSWGLTAESWSRAPEPATRAINMNHLGRVLLEEKTPPVSALFVYNANPVATVPDQNRVIAGLMREDLFTIVFEQVMTDTARYADVLLPATTFLETYDIARGYGAYSLHLVKPVIDAIGESRPNVEVFGELMQRLGVADQGEDPETEADVLMRVARTMPYVWGDALLAERAVTPPGGFTPVQFVDAFPRTADQKVDLFPSALEQEATSGGTEGRGLYVFQADPATQEYPLALISPATEKTISSTLGELRVGPARLYMHANDAISRGVTDEDTVRVFNALGEVHCLVTVGDHITPGTVSLPKGLWRHSTLNESTSNALVPDTLTDVGAGACFNDARVEVAKVIEVDLGERPLGVFVATGPTRLVN